MTGACEPRRGRVVPGPSRRPAVRPRGRPRCETVWQPLENRGAQLLRTGGSAPGSLPEGTDRLPAEHPSPGVRGSRVRGSRKAEAARMFFIRT